MYKPILVPLDESKLADQVLPNVRVLAKTRQVPIILLKALDLVHPPSTNPSHSVYMDRRFNHYRSDAEDYLGHVKNSLGGLSVPIYVAALEGDAAVRIIAEAER